MSTDSAIPALTNAVDRFTAEVRRILLDAAGAQGEVFERHVSRPRILAGFGWRCVQVPGRDWVQDPGRVVAWVERQLGAGDGRATAAAKDPAV